MSRLFRLAAVAVLVVAPAAGSERSAEPSFPVIPEVFIDVFEAAEGLTFSADGKLYINANRAIWRAEPDGRVVKIRDVYTHLGMAGIGERDILAADFGPTNVFRHGPNSDGVIWRITPEGEKHGLDTGFADPNFILVRRDGSYLVSDDGTDKIYLVDTDSTVSVWSSAIPYPNGIAFSLDESVLYAAQIFTGLDPIGFDDSLWALPVKDGRPAGEARVVARTGGGGLDGLAVDELDRVYIADNGDGKIWRFDPATEELALIAEGMPSIASLVFGEGDFDPHSLYATSTFRGGGTIWRVRVGVGGAPLHR